MKTFCRTVITALAFVLFSTDTRAITLDTFDSSTAQSITVTPGTPTAFNDFILAQTYAIGGHRLIKAQRIAGSASLTVEIMPQNVPAYPYHVSIDQGPLVQSNVSIIWDGSNHTSFSDPINYQGLGGFNFEAESGVSKFVLKNVTSDCSNLNPCKMIITVYDKNSTAGSIIASSNEMQITSTGPQDIDFLFSNFIIASGASSGLSNFKNVGAMKLDILPGVASDITFDSLTTNGISDCSSTPDLVPLNPYIIDNCGKCDGDNSSCADCAGIANGPSSPGTSCTSGAPGACTQGKWHLVNSGPPVSCSCQPITPASAELCDAIDNDCNGLVDENAICVKPLDSDNPCVTEIKGDYYQKVRKDFERQYETIRDAAYRVIGKPALRGRAQTILNKNAQLRTLTRRILSKLPKKEIFPNSACINIACVNASYKSLLANFSKNSNQWFTLAQQVIALMRENRAGGVCEGDRAYCAIRVQLREKEYQRILSTMKKYMTTHKALSKNGPLNVKNCTLK